MRYLSVCSGIEAASVAWVPLGWQAVAFSEIETFPCAVLAHHYPDVPNWGDMTRFHEWPDATVDLLVGGTPCQSFSVAGLRAGLADPRGNLALTYLAVADRYRPKWLVWENVPGVLSSGGGRDFGAFLGGLAELGYGFAYRVLDAQYFGLAQRRARVFVVGYLGDWRRAAAVLFERASLSGHPAPRRESGQGVADGITGRLGSGNDQFPCLMANYGDKWGLGDQEAFRGDHHVITYAFNARQSDVIQYGDQGGPLDTDGHSVAVAHSLRAGRGTPLVPVHAFDAQHIAVRRLTPRECERLQGFSDDYTRIHYRGKPAADGPRYKALANSMAVPVIRWLGGRIAQAEAIP